MVLYCAHWGPQLHPGASTSTKGLLGDRSCFLLRFLYAGQSDAFLIARIDRAPPKM